MAWLFRRNRHRISLHRKPQTFLGSILSIGQQPHRVTACEDARQSLLLIYDEN